MVADVGFSGTELRSKVTGVHGSVVLLGDIEQREIKMVVGHGESAMHNDLSAKCRGVGLRGDSAAMEMSSKLAVLKPVAVTTSL
jgi:hypothetical protein